MLLASGLVTGGAMLQGADKPVVGVGGAPGGGGIGSDATPAANDAQPPAAAPAAAPTSTRVYNVRDLVADLPNFPASPSALPANDSRAVGGGGGVMAGGIGSAAVGSVGLMNGAGMGGGGGPSPAADTGDTQSRLDDLIKLIIDTVDPSSWRDAGGNEGAIRYFNGSLVITQTAAAHDKIRKILTDLRADQSAMVRVRARWVLLKPSEFDHLIKAKTNASGFGSGGGQASHSVLQEVNTTELDSIAAHSVQFRAQTTCFSGQTVSIASGRQKSVVRSVEAVVGQDIGAYQPTVGLLNSGLTLQVRPTFNPDDQTVIMTIDSTFTGPAETTPEVAGRLIGATTRPSDSPGEGGNLMGNLPVMGQMFKSTMGSANGLIDRINAVSQNLRTSVRIPLDKSVLIGGMTLEPANNGEESPQLYLIIEASASM
jgi:type II secretory pathway component GspD/PulD (secretin)